MPKVGSSSKGSAGIKVGAAKPEAKSELQILQEQVAALTAQLAERAATPSGRVYAPSQTSREVAMAFLTPDEDNEETADGQTASRLRDLAHMLVKVVPGSPKTRSNPYGTPVLTKSKSGIDIVAMKDGVDRGTYIKLRNLVNQMAGNYFSYEEPKPLTEEQIDKVLRPCLDQTTQFWSA